MRSWAKHPNMLNMNPNSYGRPRAPMKARLILAVVMILFALLSYYGSSEMNEFTGSEQRVAMTKGQEIALGLQSAPQMAKEFGGLDRDPSDQARVDAVGERLLRGKSLSTSDYQYEFHLLADPKTVNAFALPGGQVFITRALYNELKTQAQLAGVLGHEIGHVAARHGAQHLAKQQLTQGLAGAAGVAVGDQSGAQMAMMVGQMVNMKYGRGDELESDRIGVRVMGEAGYDPRAIIEVMKVLKRAAGAGRQPEFFSTHPDPENRISMIEQAIAEIYPEGVPTGLDD